MTAQMDPDDPEYIFEDFRRRFAPMFFLPLVLWAIRWGIGLSIIWVAVSYRPDWAWVWWAVGAITLVWFAQFILNRTLLQWEPDVWLNYPAGSNVAAILIFGILRSLILWIVGFSIIGAVIFYRPDWPWLWWAVCAITLASFAYNILIPIRLLRARAPSAQEWRDMEQNAWSEFYKIPPETWREMEQKLDDMEQLHSEVVKTKPQGTDHH